jgi:hypothetical protein
VLDPADEDEDDEVTDGLTDEPPLAEDDKVVDDIGRCRG